MPLALDDEFLPGGYSPPSFDPDPNEAGGASTSGTLVLDEDFYTDDGLSPDSLPGSSSDLVEDPGVDDISHPSYQRPFLPASKTGVAEQPQYYRPLTPIDVDPSDKRSLIDYYDSQPYKMSKDVRDDPDVMREYKHLNELATGIPSYDSMKGYLNARRAYESETDKEKKSKALAEMQIQERYLNIGLERMQREQQQMKQLGMEPHEYLAYQAAQDKSELEKLLPLRVLEGAGEAAFINVPRDLYHSVTDDTQATRTDQLKRQLNEQVQMELDKESMIGETPARLTRKVGEVVGQMAPAMAATAITKNPSLMIPAMSVQAGVTTTGQKRAAGWDAPEAIAYGIASGIIEGISEYAGGRVGGLLGLENADTVIAKMISGKGASGVASAKGMLKVLDRGRAKSFMRWLGSGAIEGLEENLANVMYAGLDEAIGLPPGDENQLETWIIGALAGLAMSSPHLAEFIADPTAAKARELGIPAEVATPELLQALKKKAEAEIEASKAPPDIEEYYRTRQAAEGPQQGGQENGQENGPEEGPGPEPTPKGPTEPPGGGSAGGGTAATQEPGEAATERPTEATVTQEEQEEAQQAKLSGQAAEPPTAPPPSGEERGSSPTLAPQEKGRKTKKPKITQEHIDNAELRGAESGPEDTNPYTRPNLAQAWERGRETKKSIEERVEPAYRVQPTVPRINKDGTYQVADLTEEGEATLSMETEFRPADPVRYVRMNHVPGVGTVPEIFRRMKSTVGDGTITYPEWQLVPFSSSGKRGSQLSTDLKSQLPTVDEVQEVLASRRGKGSAKEEAALDEVEQWVQQQQSQTQSQQVESEVKQKAKLVQPKKGFGKKKEPASERQKTTIRELIERRRGTPQGETNAGEKQQATAVHGNVSHKGGPRQGQEALPAEEGGQEVRPKEVGTEAGTEQTEGGTSHFGGPARQKGKKYRVLTYDRQGKRLVGRDSYNLIFTANDERTVGVAAERWMSSFVPVVRRSVTDRIEDRGSGREMSVYEHNMVEVDKDGNSIENTMPFERMASRSEIERLLEKEKQGNPNSVDKQRIKRVEDWLRKNPRLEPAEVIAKENNARITAKTKKGFGKREAPRAAETARTSETASEPKKPEPKKRAPAAPQQTEAKAGVKTEPKIETVSETERVHITEPANLAPEETIAKSPVVPGIRIIALPAGMGFQWKYVDASGKTTVSPIYQTREKANLAAKNMRIKERPEVGSGGKDIKLDTKKVEQLLPGSKVKALKGGIYKITYPNGEVDYILPLDNIFVNLPEGVQQRVKDDHTRLSSDPGGMSQALDEVGYAGAYWMFGDRTGNNSASMHGIISLSRLRVGSDPFSPAEAGAYRTLLHETLHGQFRRGIFTQQEYQSLYDQYGKDREGNKIDPADSAAVEEAVVRGLVADWGLTKSRNFWQKIIDFAKRMLESMGLSQFTPDFLDIIADMHTENFWARNPDVMRRYGGELLPSMDAGEQGARKKMKGPMPGGDVLEMPERKLLNPKTREVGGLKIVHKFENLPKDFQRNFSGLIDRKNVYFFAGDVEHYAVLGYLKSQVEGTKPAAKSVDDYMRKVVEGGNLSDAMDKAVQWGIHDKRYITFRMYNFKYTTGVYEEWMFRVDRFDNKAKDRIADMARNLPDFLRKYPVRIDINPFRRWESENEARLANLTERELARMYDEDVPQMSAGEEQFKGTRQVAEPKPGDITIDGHKMRIKPVPIDRIVATIARVMGGKIPSVRKLRSLGAANQEKGEITINPKLAQDPKALAGTLAHEFGHIADAMPELVNRGNILGRIATMVKYTKGMIEGMKGGPPPLTQAEKDEIHKQAAKLARKEKAVEIEVDETVLKPLKAQDILDIWNSMTGSSSPELLAYVKGLPIGSIEELVRSALKGVVPEEVQKFAAIVKTGKKVKKRKGVATSKDISDKYAELLKDEVRKRQLLSADEIMEELRAVSRMWRGDFEKGDRYRDSGSELYADAISVLFNSPGDLIRLAPEFSRGFFNYLGEKREFREAYLAIQDLLSGTTEEVAEARLQEQYAMQIKGDKAWVQRNKELHAMSQSVREYLNQLLLNSGAPVYARDKALVPWDQVRTAMHALQDLNARENPVSLFVRDTEKIFSGLLRQGVTYDDIGVYMLNLRIAKGDRAGFAEEAKKAIMEATGHYDPSKDADGKEWERAQTNWRESEKQFRETMEDDPEEVSKIMSLINEVDMSEEEAIAHADQMLKDTASAVINPGGHTAKTAQENLDYLKQKMGGPKYQAVVDAVQKYQDARWRYIEEAVEAGVYNGDLVKRLLMKNKDFYVPFIVLKYLDTTLNAGIYKQIGTFNEVFHAFKGSVLKTVSLIRLTEFNKAKTEVVELLNRTGEADPMVPVDRFHPPKAPRKGKVNLWLLKDGKWHTVGVPPEIGAVFKTHDVGTLRRTTKFLGLAYNVFHPLWVSYNPSWAIRNWPRDIFRTYKNAAVLHADEPKIKQFLSSFKDIPEFAYESYKSITPSMRRSLGMEDVQIRTMEENRDITSPFIKFRVSLEDESFTSLQKQAGTWKRPPSEWKIVNGLMRAADFVETVGVFTETHSKVVMHRMAAKRGFSPSEVAYLVNTYAGTPGTNRHGLVGDVLNSTLMYYNVIAQGWNADIEVATNPKTMVGYWTRAALFQYGPKMLMIMAALGWLSDDLKEFFDDIPEYEKTKYLIFPAGRINGKPQYIRIPHSDTDRPLAGMMWKAATGKGIDQTVHAMLNVGFSDLPSLNPMISLGSKWFETITGQRPRDNFRNKPIWDDDIEKIGGLPRYKKMLQFTTDQFGVVTDTVGFATTFFSDDEVTTYEKTIKIPGIGALLKINDRGHEEKQWEAIEQEEKKDALFRHNTSDRIRRLNSTRYKYNKFNKAQTITEEQDNERVVLNAWHSRVYLPGRTAAKLAEERGDKRLMRKILDELDESARMLQNGRLSPPMLGKISYDISAPPARPRSGEKDFQTRYAEREESIRQALDVARSARVTERELVESLKREMRASGRSLNTDANRLRIRRLVARYRRHQ